MTQESIQRIAIVRLSALGDVCHAMSVVSAIQKRYPQASITWITGPAEAQLARLIPNIDVRVYDKKSGFKGMFALGRALKVQEFDVLLHMQWSLRASLLTRVLKAKRRIGFARSHSREKQHWFVNELAPEPSGKHVLDALMSLARAIDVPEQAPAWHVDIPPSGLDLPKRYVVVNPCGSKVTKDWMLEGYRTLIASLLENHIDVVVTGGPSEREMQVCRAVSEGLDVLNLVGQTSITSLFDVIQRAELVISPDTGPAHMATVVNTPVIALFALSNPMRTGPYNDQENVVSVYRELVEEEKGKPVEMLPWATTVHREDAMAQLPIDRVMSKVNKVIRQLDLVG
ncbi:Lipopolysaccharide core heptosyltransferase RfaQ [Marinomonas spartinae]|uniref:Lipopolysaccharide core heptosyltransferase RfaQ n=1 Tax=Marinomonas spartinae TaxID=1792290 RepID=A0A1A8TCA2_9GAMM|nr:glycosyltransferase family 9 protein [Marinomonas spartinae]SBS30655.1 Lipopolysaccharide core heptosyltransferase RfaQ [Marinomonas spartinae]